jgi:transformation/transcription domain-associated protein
VNLYRGFLAICHPEDPHLSVVERYVELSSGLCMREWRRLPHIVSHIHLPLLQAAQQVSLLYQGQLELHPEVTCLLHLSVPLISLFC